MSTQLPISASYGSENYARGQCGLHCFYVDKQTKKEVALGMAPVQFAAEVSVLQHRVEVLAIKDTPAEVGGSWKTGSFKVNAGTLIKVFGKKRERWNSLMEMACLMLEVDEEAPYQSVSMTTLAIPGVSAKQTVTVEGRFNILTAAEIADRGVVLAPSAAMQFTDTCVKRLFKVKIIEKGTKKETITQQTKVMDGDREVTVTTKARAIVLDLD
jgi:hypothetical protein